MVGATESQTFTIRNVGAADLEITAASLVGGDAKEFAIAQAGTPVHPGSGTKPKTSRSALRHLGRQQRRRLCAWRATIRTVRPTTLPYRHRDHSARH